MGAIFSSEGATAPIFANSGINLEKQNNINGATAPSIKNNSYRNMENQTSKNEVAINMPKINVKNKKNNVVINIPKNIPKNNNIVINIPNNKNVIEEDPTNLSPSPTSMTGGKRKTRKSKKSRKSRSRKH
jgi:hypothetical protein